MKQTISLPLLSCALLLSISSLHAMNKVHTNGNSNIAITSSAYNIDEQAKLNNDKVLFEASQKIAIEAFAHDVTEIFVKNVDDTIKQADKAEFENQLKAEILKNAQFTTGQTLFDTCAAWVKWEKTDAFKAKLVGKWVDSLSFYNREGKPLATEKQKHIKDTLKAHAVAIYDAQVKHFAPKKEVQAKNAWQTRFNINKLSRATLGFGFTALAGIVLYLNYKFGTKTHPFPTKLPTKISTINFKVPFYGRS